MKNAVPSAARAKRTSATTSICKSGWAPRASSAPTSGALAACVNGIERRAGPITAVDCASPAIEAAQPVVSPWRDAARATATPPGSATQ